MDEIGLVCVPKGMLRPLRLLYEFNNLGFISLYSWLPLSLHNTKSTAEFTTGDMTLERKHKDIGSYIIAWKKLQGLSYRCM